MSGSLRQFVIELRKASRTKDARLAVLGAMQNKKSLSKLYLE